MPLKGTRSMSRRDMKSLVELPYGNSSSAEAKHTIDKEPTEVKFDSFSMRINCEAHISQ